MGTINLLRTEVNAADYFFATYNIKSKTTLWDAAYNIAVGQSIGNPKVRNSWETDDLYEKHCCKIMAGPEIEHMKSGQVVIAFPKANINMQEDGISQLLCFLMGGHLDIDIIETCQLIGLSGIEPLYSPTFGLEGMRDFCGVHGKPLLGGIVKPKTGLNPHQLLDLTKQLVEGGVNFIKEDEILGNPACCPLMERVELIQKYLHDKKVIYCYCINGDYPYCVNRAEDIAKAGGNGIHINVWSGLGVYKTIRQLDNGLFIHFQKSGDRAFTSPHHNFHIAWPVICQLAGLMGVDSIHAGMWGGYSSNSEQELNDCLKVLKQYHVVPALSCGMHPGIVNKVTELFGCDYMANVGGAIHGHPGGTLAGVKAMRQAIDGTFGPEYEEAIKIWGLIK